jgi:hypothetical protein
MVDVWGCPVILAALVPVLESGEGEGGHDLAHGGVALGIRFGSCCCVHLRSNILVHGNPGMSLGFDNGITKTGTSMTKLGHPFAMSQL